MLEESEPAVIPTALLVPIRSFDDALSRLGHILDREQRRGLMRILAERVLAAAGPYPVYVVTADASAAGWAARNGATVLRLDCMGLSADVQAAVQHLASAGIARVVVAHADLPRVESFQAMIGPGFRIAPDRRRDGSNVICIPTDSGFCFAYGPGSFRRHLAEAERRGLAVSVVEDPALALDMDHPDDLRDAGLDLSAAMARPNPR